MYKEPRYVADCCRGEGPLRPEGALQTGARGSLANDPLRLKGMSPVLMPEIHGAKHVVSVTVSWLLLTMWLLCERDTEQRLCLHILNGE